MKENSQDPAQVMIVAPISSLRVGLNTILAGTPGIEIVAEAAGLDGSGLLPPQAEIVVAALVEIPSETWLLSVLESYPQVTFLFLINAAAGLPAFVFPSNRVLGILNLNAGPEEIGAAIGALKTGFSVIDPLTVGEIKFFRESPGKQQIGSGQVQGLVNDDRAVLLDPLTGREIEILQALALGLTNKEIARRLAISEHTVKFHITSIYSKLGANNRTEAVRQGVHLGIITI